MPFNLKMSKNTTQQRGIYDIDIDIDIDIYM